MLLRLMITACMVLTSTLSMVGIVHAGSITSFTVEVTDGNVGATADHTVQFVTPSGVDSPGDVIVLTYGSGADLSGVSIPSDITLAEDNDGECDGAFTQKLLAIAASANTWGIDLSSQNLTFTPPTNASAGEITGGRCVQITIAGVGNPSSAGSVQLAVAGPFGDSGYGAFSVSDSNQVSVTARVGTGGEAGTNDITPSDTTPPVIYNVEISNVSETSATISWFTDDYANTLLEWGTDTQYALGQVSDIQLLLTHSETITGLVPGVTYYARLTSADFVGNAAVYDLVTFTTADETAPTIIDPQVTQISTTSATIQWLTDELSDSVVKYGLTDAYELGEVTDSVMTIDHTLILSELESGTTYYFLVHSMDANGNEGLSDGMSFQTEFDYAPSNVTLRVTARDGMNSLIWTLPSDDDLAGVRVIYRTDRYPDDPFDGELLTTDLATSFDHTGLTNGITYFYGVFAYDVGGNIASGALASGTPSGLLVAEVPPESIESPSPSPEESTYLGIPQPTLSVGTGQASTEETLGITQPTLSVGSSAQVSVSVAVANGSITLSPVAEDTYRVLYGFPFIFGVMLDGSSVDLERATVTLNGSTYNLSNITAVSDGQASNFVFGHIASIEAPSVGLYTVVVTVMYANGVEQTFTYTLEVISFGQVFEIIENQSERIDGVRLGLYEQTSEGWTLFDTSPYGEKNPLVSSENEHLAWYVPNGTYDVRGSRDGYLNVRTGVIDVTDNIIVPSIRMYRVPQSISEILASPLSLQEKITEVWQEVSALYQTIVHSVIVESVMPVVMVTAVTATGFSLYSLVTLFIYTGLKVVTTCPRTKREWDEQEMRRQKRRRNHHVLLRISIIACAVLIFLRPTVLNIAVFTTSVMLTLLTKRLAKASTIH